MIFAPPDLSVFAEISFDDLEAEPVRAGYLYWQSLRGDRRFPPREELSPRALKPLLRNLVLIKVLDGANDFHMGIVGDEVQRAYDVPLNNRLLSDIIKEAPTVMPGWHDRYRRVALSGEPLFIRVRAGLGEANFIHREVAVLPIGCSEVTHVMTFGKHELRHG